MPASFLLPLGCALVLAVTSCAVQHELPNGALTSSRTAPLEATTYCLMDGWFEPWDDALQRTDLHREVERQLSLRGYRSLEYGPGLQPDLLVYCSLYEGTYRFAPVSFPERYPSAVPPPRQTLRDGSLVIHFFDTRLRRVTWSGYADGLRDGEWVADERLLPRAAQQILDDYRRVAPMVSSRGRDVLVGRSVKRRLLRE